ncbi:hypothetical protein DHEL01_v212128 [Diaporthe helianthi]|uniref:Uncharacterized protein n=1 Tax=Diaporthe helianthi TaxID=158607 RepID=A0A2P5HGU9_DIAHE|nr:hypothetical protein DHEL01_v212128 [Diaporthe helianthi]
MPKRPASGISRETLRTGSKKVRLDRDLNSETNTSTPSTWTSPMRASPRKRPAPEDSEADGPSTSTHASKKARTGDRPRHGRDFHLRISSQWPDIDDRSRPDISAETAQLQQSRQRIRTAIDRAEHHFRELQQEYIRFRESRNRLPSPVLSDEGSGGSDSEADQYGCTPMMLGMENDDPRVEEVFGIEYARRLEERSRHRPSTRSLPPHMRRKTFPTTELQRRGRQRRRTTSRTTTVATKHPRPELTKALPRRQTRQSRHLEAFYELDNYGRARLV